MGLLNGKIGDPVAEKVFPVPIHCRRRLNAELPVLTLLPRCGAREEVGLILALRHRRRIAVLGNVGDAIAYHLEVERVAVSCCCTSIWLK